MSDEKAKLYVKSGGFKRGTFVILEAGPFHNVAEAELFMFEMQEMWKLYSEKAGAPMELKNLPPLAKTGQIEQAKSK